MTGNNGQVRNVLDWLETSAGRFPDKTAFADETEQLTFAELVRSARIIGTKVSSVTEALKPVPVMMEKSTEAVASFMGAAYAGCFYVLLDPRFPDERLNAILKTLGADLLITVHAEEEKLASIERPATVIFYEDCLRAGKTDDRLLADRRNRACDTDPLYAIFTSGSTGVPKGVVVSHRSVIDFIPVFTERFSVTDQDVFGNQAPFDFDVSVKDIYSVLYTGASAALIPKKMFSIPTKLLDYLEEKNVTTLVWAVSALCLITTFNGFSYRIPSKIRRVMFSGEVMPPKHLKKWQKAYPQAMFVNLYGPTEITCNCTYHIVDHEAEPGEKIPAGVPFDNEKVFLLDEENRLIPQNVPDTEGEICVAGTCLALGYFNNPEQTAKAFVQNPLNRNYPETVYRTGDLGVYGPDGLLYYTSRKDFQIKHMGHRIELGEIENAMDRVPGVDRCCVLFREEKKKICAFYEGTADRETIVAGIGKFLPSFMIPNEFTAVEQLPITKNGKVDRRELAGRYWKQENR